MSPRDTPRFHPDLRTLAAGRTAVTTPAVVIGAPASGAGKTIVATGLMAALRQSGNRVAGFKVGPDFIDPGYHALATGRPGRNLDPVLVGDALIAPLYAHGCQGADIAVVEGVMGLFDGRIDDRSSDVARGSTAQVAALIGAPVLLVVDARGQSQSIAAVLHGFSTFDRQTRLAGVILNRVGSARHEQVLRQACDSVGVDVLGVLPRADDLEVPSRHLGLVTAAEYGAAACAAVDAMAELVHRHIDLDAVSALARTRAGAVPWRPDVVGPPVPGNPVVAVARGCAFTFSYPEHTELLSAAGARVVGFDPLTDALPEHTAAVVLPGGFPEQYPGELSANAALRQQIARLARHAPVYAECAGLTYLMSELDGHPMCDVLHGAAHFTGRLTLGYRDAVAQADSPSYAVGHRIVGHEFHRTTVVFAEDYPRAWAFRGAEGRTVEDGAVHRGVHASYLHTHPAAAPAAVRNFVAHAATSRLAR